MGFNRHFCMTSIHHTPGAAHLLAQLQRSQALHNEGVADIEYELSRLRRWQSTRLARTHADVLHNPRYRPAAEFFLDELYGDRDFRQREHGGTIWYVGDWKTGHAVLPKEGSWEILQEVKAEGVADDQSSIRAVEIRLKD